MKPAIGFQFMKCIPLILLEILPFSIARGHRDPIGDVDPLVRVENGNFVIYTWQYGAEHNYSPVRRTVYTPDGHLLIAAQVVKDDKTLESLKWKGPMASNLGPQNKVHLELNREDQVPVKPSAEKPPKDPFGGEIARPFETTPGFFFCSPDEKKWKRILLPLDSKTATSLESSLIRREDLALAWGKFAPTATVDNPTIELVFALIERSKLKLLHEINLGECAAIYDFAVVSNLMWATNRIWLAWVKKAENADALPPTKRWASVLASIDPGSGEVHKELLPEQSHWNAHLSMNVCDDWLCLAWHCSDDGSYPGAAKILTVFRKLH